MKRLDECQISLWRRGLMRPRVCQRGWMNVISVFRRRGQVRRGVCPIFRSAAHSLAVPTYLYLPRMLTAHCPHSLTHLTPPRMALATSRTSSSSASGVDVRRRVFTYSTRRLLPSRRERGKRRMSQGQMEMIGGAAEQGRAKEEFLGLAPLLSV